MRVLLVGLAAAGLVGCLSLTQETEFHPLKVVPIPAPTPAELDVWTQEFRAGRAWRGDPCNVAHVEIQKWLDVPWKGESFDPTKYAFHEVNPKRPEWGSYVVRGFTDRTGRHFRYRVKVARDGEIWIPREVDHYVIVTLPHERFDEDNLPPMVGER